MAEEEHGVVVLSRLLKELDGKTIHITANQESKADFDRRVRESIDRQHRRQIISGS